MSEPQLYWLDGCESNGWTVNQAHGTFEIYSGDSHDGLACLRSTARGWSWGFPGGTGYAAGYCNATKVVDATIPAIGGRFTFVFGGWVKLKQTSGNWRVGIEVKDIQGNTLATIPVRSFNPTLNVWHNFEMVYATQKGEFYMDGIKILEDTASRINAPPAAVVISTYNENEVTTEALFDTLYISSSPNLNPPETFSLSISAGGGGTTDPIPGDYTIPAAQIVRITAIPADASKLPFSHWLLNGIRYTENPLIILMDRPYIVQAVFSTPTQDMPSWLWVLVALVGGAILLGSDKKPRAHRG